MRRVLLLASLGLFLAGGVVTATPPKEIAVTPADAPAIKKAIAARKGRVVVLNFWATWCGPCVAEYPFLVRLHRQYAKKGLVVMSVSADLKKDLDGKVRPFLTKQKADFPQFLEQADDPEDFINAFDVKWQGDLPRTFVYDRQGRLVKTLSGGQEYPAFVAAVTPYLK